MKHSSSAAPAGRGRTWSLLAAVVLCLAGRLPAFEFDYWPKAIVTVPLDPQWQFRVEEWLSFTDNVGRFKDSQTDVWLNYFGLADWLCVGAGYKKVYAQDDDDWTTEDRPMLDAAVKTKVGGFGVTDRSRLEYRLVQDEDEVWRYRNRLTVTSRRLRLFSISSRSFSSLAYMMMSLPALMRNNGGTSNILSFII